MWDTVLKAVCISSPKIRTCFIEVTPNPCISGAMVRDLVPKKGTKQMYLSQPRATPLHEGHARLVTNCQANAGDFSANPNLALSTSTRGPARVEAPFRSPTAARAQSVKQIKTPRSSLTAGLHHELTEKWDAVADPGAQYCVH
jgi:hypothetical protein